jgi:hypothetical protein
MGHTPAITSSRPFPAGRLIGMMCVGAMLKFGLSLGGSSSGSLSRYRLTIKLAGEEGFEPTPGRLTTACSTAELPPTKLQKTDGSAPLTSDCLAQQVSIL